MKTFITILIVWLVGTWLLSSLASSFKNKKK